MKHILTILLALSFSNNLWACLAASQNRLYPLGKTKQGLCVVETRLNRTEYRGPGINEVKMIPCWYGIAYYKIYDAKYKVVYTEVLDSIAPFKEKYYDSIISQSFEKGLSKAKKLPDFRSAIPNSMLFCDFQEKCSKAEMVYDTIANTISVKLPNKISYEVNILFDSSSIAANIIELYSSYEDVEKITAKLLKGELSISSVRQYSIGNKKLTIVHIAVGQGFEYLDEKDKPVPKEYKPTVSYNNINKSIFKEPVIHHGHGFDFFVFE